MALFDFLGNDLSGASYNIPNPGVTGADITSGRRSVADVTGENAATMAQSGMTYGDLLAAIMSMSKRGALAGAISGQTGQPNQIGGISNFSQKKQGGNSSSFVSDLVNQYGSFLGL